MAAPLKASLPDTLDLPDGYIVQWAAIDPNTGADIAGVVVTNVSLFGTLLSSPAGGGGNTVVGPYMLVPGPAA